MAEIDTLQIKIVANAQSATGALKSLASALQSVKTQLTGVSKDGISSSERLAKSLNEMNGALNSINTSSIKKLQKLANALNDYSDALKKTRALGKSIKDIGKAISDTTYDVASDVNVGRFAEDNGLTVKSESAISTGGSADVKQNTKDWLNWHSAIEKESKKAGEQVKKTTNIFGKFIKSIGRIALYRAIRSALKAVGEAFSEGLKNAYGYSKQSETFTRLADTLDRVKSITSQMVNQLGAFWGEIRQFIMPAIEWIVEAVRKIAEYATELFAALNGETTYLQAQYVAQAWDDSIDKVKEYKHQLLGLDELNVLTDNKGSSSKKEETDYTKLYKEMPVSASMLKIGEAWNTATTFIKTALSEIESALGGFMIGMGAVLLFSGTNIPLGLGLIITGGYMAGKEIAEQWDLVGKTVADKVAAIEAVLAGFLAGVGAVLAFSGANIPLGIGLMIAGATIFAVSAATMDWGELESKVKLTLTKIALVMAGASLAVGTILTMCGHFAIGIPLLAAGAAGLVTMVAINWNSAEQEIKNAVAKVMAAVGGFLLVMGLLLTFSGGAPAIGIPMIIAGAAGLVTAITFNWDYILDSLKQAWENIKAWWNNTVIGSVRRGVENVESLLNIDINGNGVIGAVMTTHESSTGAVHGGVHGKFAAGGIPTQGSLFYAGEAGAEFVGNIGSTSAVANTGQMTDAIYKAAYMGMSKALKENGGNGMAGFEPATTDDLFIAMRKKANNYNKMTGNSAFA